MKKIKMQLGDLVLNFIVTYEGSEYIFCECPEKPEARGFFTNQYINKHKK